MTARPFSRIEPISTSKDPARVVAGFFTLVAGIGALPAVYGTLMLLLVLYGAIGEARFAQAGGAGLVLSYAVLGFAQLRFYARRAVGKAVENARGWWLSTYLYNLVPVGISIAVMIDGPHVGAVAAGVWFACLSTLAVIAYANEPRSPR